MSRIERIARPIALLMVLLLAGAGDVCAASKKRTDAERTVRHRVTEGETVYAVGRHYDVSPQAIIRANKLRAPYHVLTGQSLIVPGAKAPASAQGDSAGKAAKAMPRTAGERDASEKAPDDGPALRGADRRARAKAYRAALQEADGPVRGRVKPGQSPQDRAAAIGPVADKIATAARRAAPEATGRAAPSRKAAAPKGKDRGAQGRRGAPAPEQPRDAADGEQSSALPKVPPRSGKSFAWPVKGKVSQGFGRTPGAPRNDGITIRAKPGSDVRAAENGVVIFAGEASRTSGPVVLLKHADGWITTYSPVADIKVGRAQVVKKGDVIGRVSRGNVSTQPQLHFQARHDGVPVDPLARMAGRAQVAAR